jgi:hypothetical protein
MFHKEYMKLRDWIDVEYLDWHNLCFNPNAICLLERQLEQEPDKIDWYWLSLHPNAIHLLEANPEKIDRSCLFYKNN